MVRCALTLETSYIPSGMVASRSREACISIRTDVAGVRKATSFSVVAFPISQVVQILSIFLGQEVPRVALHVVVVRFSGVVDREHEDLSSHSLFIALISIVELHFLFGKQS